MKNLIQLSTENRITMARYFAIEIHGNQKYDSYPYIKHLEDVYNVLISFGIYDSELLSAAFLHDAIEDGATSYNKIKEKFGILIAEMVYAITDELGRNRKERHMKTYPKIRSNLKGIVLKLADRISNVTFSASKDVKKSLLDMYKKEYDEFKSNIYLEKEDIQYCMGCNKNDIELIKKLYNMWGYLDKLMGYEN